MKNGNSHKDTKPQSKVKAVLGYAKKPAMHHYLDAGAQALVCTHCQSVSPIPLGDLTFVTGVFKLWDRAHRSCKPGSSPRTWNSKPTIAISTEDNIETKRTDIRPPPGERT